MTPRFSDHDFQAFLLYAHRELELDVSEDTYQRCEPRQCHHTEIGARRRANLSMLLRETTPDADAGWERDPHWSPRATDRNR